MSVDKTMAKLMRPIDFKSTAGTMLRGNNVYRGGVNNAVSGSRSVPGLKKPKPLKTKVPSAAAIRNYLIQR